MDADGARDGARRKRTVKPCGSDAAIAGVKFMRMLPPNLYARVHALVAHVAHETAGAARTRSSLRPRIGEGKRRCRARANSCRENAKAYPRHCERSEAIHASAHVETWIASLRSQ